MTQTRDLETFHRLNHVELIRCITARVWHASREDIEDIASYFYGLMIHNSTLQRYNESKGAWSSWILNTLDWSIRAVMRRASHSQDELPSDLEAKTNHDIAMKILDWHAWIEKYGGTHKSNLLNILEDKIKGNQTWVRYSYWENLLYRSLTASFLAADSTIIGI